MPASKDQTGATFVSSPSRSVVDNLTKMRERSHQNLWHCEMMKCCLKINAM